MMINDHGRPVYAVLDTFEDAEQAHALSWPPVTLYHYWVDVETWELSQ